jgi:hypothetical protein
MIFSLWRLDMDKLRFSLAVFGVVIITMVIVNSAVGLTHNSLRPPSDKNFLYDATVIVYSDALRIANTDLVARLDAGESLADVAYSTGLSEAEFCELVISLREKVINMAVKNRTITQEQSERVISRWNGQDIGTGFSVGPGTDIDSGSGWDEACKRQP